MTSTIFPIFKSPYPQAKSVDVLLLLEGTFPFVSGGVSSWVNQIMLGFPDIRFGAIFLGSRAQDYGEMRYSLPDNLVHLDVVYLYDHADNPPIVPVKASAQTMDDVERMHEMLFSGMRESDNLELFSELLNQACPHGKLSSEVFLYSQQAWEYIKKGYRQRSTDPSFVDYFWTIRTMHSPFWRLREVAGHVELASGERPRLASAAGG